VTVTLDVLFGRAGFSPNPSQRLAIEHGEGPLFLVAGPGSGKTRVLLWRTVNLIVIHQVPPEAIFLSTFTEKAAKQLQDGLISLLGIASEFTGCPYDLSGMYVGTVHSLCHRLIQDRSLAPGRERTLPPVVLDALDQYFELASGAFWREAKALLGFEGELSALRELLTGTLDERASGSRHRAVVNLQSLFNRLSEEDLEPAALLAGASEETLPLFKLYALYRERLGERRVDLSLLQRAAHELLVAHEAPARRFRHVIVDEYQDTNAIQERIFFRLASLSKNVCVVGDDDQALYRFRGATVENFVEFPARCKAALGASPTRIELGINYRSRAGVVSAYSTLIAQMDWTRPGGGQFRLHDKGVVAHSSDVGTAVVATTPSKPVELVEEVAGLVKRLIDEGVVSDPNQIAFLFPTLKSSIVEKYEEALRTLDLKVYAPRAKRFLEADEPTLVMGLLGKILGRPPRNDQFDRGEYAEFHAWLDAAAGFADDALTQDPSLQDFVRTRIAELEAIRKDHLALVAVLEDNGWDLKHVYDPGTHKRALLGAKGLSADARRALGGVGLDKLHKERSSDGTPLSLSNVINRGTTADWGLLDLFYRFLGFSKLRALIDLADGGVDEGPTCNLALTSQLLARYVDTFPALITGAGLATGMLQAGFYHAFLFALFRLGEGEYEDAEDPFPKGRIPFLTVHQSKGLEFPVVVLGSARTNRRTRRVEEIVRPFLPEGGEPLDRMPGFDAMRMFYVALSRAQNLLVIAHPRGQGQRVDGEFGVLLDNAVVRIPDFDPSTVPAAKADSSDAVRRFSYTGDYLAYQRCPRHYMLFERYGFAASRTQTMFFGSLVHATIEDLHHRMIARRSAGGAT
jgi:DNA helicase-2/ATP-dependent DNA helicase PcrA